MHHSGHVKIQQLERQVRTLTMENKRLRKQLRQSREKEEKMKQKLSFKDQVFLERDEKPLEKDSAVLAYVMNDENKDPGSIYYNLYIYIICQ